MEVRYKKASKEDLALGTLFFSIFLFPFLTVDSPAFLIYTILMLYQNTVLLTAIKFMKGTNKKSVFLTLTLMLSYFLFIISVEYKMEILFLFLSMVLIALSFLIFQRALKNNILR